MVDLVPSICPYCGTGCGFYIVVENGLAVGLEYMTEHPLTGGSLCSKGNAALEILGHQDRLRYPMKRVNDQWVRISWDEALKMVADGLKRTLKEHGPESIGFLGSAKATNEENYLFQKLARSLGTNNIDHCARLCQSPTIAGLMRSLGAGLMTNQITDLRNADCILVIGANFAETQPLVARWALLAKEQGATLIYVDPRFTPTAWLADIFLQINPGSDLALLCGMMHVILKEGLEDSDFIARRTSGFPELEKSLDGYAPERVARISGVSAKMIVKAARIYAKAKSSAIVYSMGITQHACGFDNVTACANLALICGNFGRPGTGLLPLRGQNNVQGACDMGVLPNYYPGYVAVEDPKIGEIFGDVWGSDALPQKVGLSALEMIDATARGEIRAMYIMGEDPVNSDPNSERTEDALMDLDFLVVQEIFPTDTARMADLVLPASVWAEKEGTFTSTERRVQWTSRALGPPDEARCDLWIVCQVAKRMGLDFGYKNAAEVLSEINRFIPSYRGATPLRVMRIGGLTLPCPDILHPGTPILHVDEFSTPDGRGRIIPVHHVEAAEMPSAYYPLVLTTGREVFHHNAGSMTRRSPSLLKGSSELFVDICDSDARELNLAGGEMVRVATARGEVEAKARVTEKVKKGVVFMPFHYPSVNKLTSDALDPVAKIPEFKVAACRVSRGR